ncbi:MAG: hypothetical protein JKY52_20905 [Flavobacteriales bacterium]|nr:hypothetical protein [Flavobacteriales bacterium]
MSALNIGNIGRFTIYLVGLLVACDTSAQGPPIFTETPIMLGLDGGGVRTFGKYISKENTTVYMHPIAIPFNISSKWQVGAVIPFAYKKPNGLKDQFGLGDISVFTKHQLFQKDGKGKTFRTLIKLTETFPSGNSTGLPQLGTGAWQTTLGIISGYITLKYGLYAEVAYNLTSDGLPDKLLYNTAFSYPLLPQQYPPKQINVSIELNGTYIVENSSNYLFISPGAQWIAGKRFLLETGLQLPLIEDVPDGQKTNFMYTLGTRILIF